MSHASKERSNGQHPQAWPSESSSCLMSISVAPSNQGVNSNHKANNSKQRSRDDPSASPQPPSYRTNNYHHPSPTAYQPLPKTQKRAPPSPKPNRSYTTTTTASHRHLLPPQIFKTRNLHTASAPHRAIPSPSASSSTPHKATHTRSKTKKVKVYGGT